jgi:glyoxylase-like metal-dependent hydrolase (beta-lactamase superfamily II)
MSEIAHEGELVEVADRCWTARFDFLDVNVGVVAGDAGLLVVDSLASEPAARRLVGELRRRGLGDVVAVVNTHHHFDHTFGNVVLLEEYDGVAIHAHEAVPAELERHGPEAQREAAADTTVAEHADVAAARIRPPTRTFSSARAVDLGDRLVEVVHPGRGHTAGDVVVRVGDADVLFAGDLVEESALRDGVPGFGPDCYPMEWPGALDLVVGLLGPGSVVVPGHGRPVDLTFVEEQRQAIGVVAETIRDLAGRGVPVADAVDSAAWPYPAEQLHDAVRRGYEQLPRSARSLPLL